MRRVGRALVCAPLLPEYDRERGSWRVFSVIEILRQAGWAVSFAAQNAAGGERYKRILEQQGVPVYAGLHGATDDLVAHGRLDVVVFAFWHTAAAYMATVRTLSPSTRVLIDTIDLHFLRNARRALGWSGSGEGGGLDDRFGAEMVQELNAYARADAVITVSKKEAELLRDLAGRGIRANVVPDSERLWRSTIPFDKRKGIVFVGNFRHPPNVEAVEYLLHDIVPRLPPKLLRKHPVSIVGNGMTQTVQELGRGLADVSMVGWVPSVLPYIERARVSVIPVLHGAGTKGKLVQALSLGTPTVSSSLGTEGLGLRHDKHLLVADDPASFARSVARLLEDQPLWARIANEGAVRITLSHGWDVARDRLLRVVEVAMREPAKESQSPPPAHRTQVDEYGRLITRIRKCVETTLPKHGTVLVVSKGDDRLLDLGSRVAWHFPMAHNGLYAGHHPRDSAEAIDHLEFLRQRGAEYLLLPETGFWWMDYYEQFSKHLNTNYRSVPQDDDACLVFALGKRVRSKTARRAPASGSGARSTGPAGRARPLRSAPDPG